MDFHVRTSVVPVSILAPRRRGACHRARRDHLVGFAFQSSLPVAGERVGAGGRGSWGPGCFNPRSPSPGSVSIHPGRGTDTLQGFNPRSPSPGSVSGITGGSCPRYFRFNPRSPSPGSVSTCSAVVPCRRCVSILAPRRRGACPGWLDRNSEVWVFQSSLPVAGERVLPHRIAMTRTSEFQSSLPVAGERVRSRPSARACSGFGSLCANLDANGVLHLIEKCLSQYFPCKNNDMQGARTSRISLATRGSRIAGRTYTSNGAS